MRQRKIVSWGERAVLGCRRFLWNVCRLNVIATGCNAVPRLKASAFFWFYPISLSGSKLVGGSVVNFFLGFEGIASRFSSFSRAWWLRRWYYVWLSSLLMWRLVHFQGWNRWFESWLAIHCWRLLAELGAEIRKVLAYNNLFPGVDAGKLWCPLLLPNNFDLRI